MSEVKTHPVMSEDTAEWLSERFAEAFRTFDIDPDAFHAGAFFDLNMPIWRFQLQGASAFGEQLQKISRGPSRVEIIRTIPTASGFVTEQVEHEDIDGEDHVARRLWLLDVRDGRISEAVGYCTGGWDPALQERHAIEAPMLRP